MNEHRVDDPVTMERMRRLPLFATLSDSDLDTLYRMTRTVMVHAGHILMTEGSPSDAAYVVVDGELEVTTQRGDQELLIAVRRDGELVGEMSLLEQTARSATVRAARDSCLLEVTQAALETLLSCSRAARWAILGGVASRLRSTESLLEQRARLAKLGELAADLAHEINNPAAAVLRSVAQLRDALDARDRLAAQLAGQRPTDEQLAALERLRVGAVEHARQPADLAAFDRADREDELLLWLEERGVARAWDVAEVLTSYGWTSVELGDLAQSFADDEGALVVQLAAASTHVQGLLGEIGRSAQGITERVQAVKEYAFLDQAPVQRVDVHHGLETTLIMLRHKLKSGIAVRREYAPNLPRIEAYGSELNQVWTNLIDNALDAMGGQGELWVRTSHQTGWVTVGIADTGPGISESILPRIFEVGFTTKPPGQGSGRGLHIVRNIVEDKHRGRLDVISNPGRTEFQVRLPIELPSRALTQRS
jgi:signal transduction histidine kinase